MKSSEQRICSALSRSFRWAARRPSRPSPYGTKTVPRADRIVGPGNIYVAAAKKLLAGDVGIDFVAGPTEILIIAAEGDPRFLAADMLAQAEHDTDASAILLTTSKRLAGAGGERNRPPACHALDRARGAPGDRQEQRDHHRAARSTKPLNSPTPSRRSTSAFTIDELLPKIRHAGSIFVGPCSPEAAGDYCLRTQPRPADQRRRPPARRTFRGRLRQGDLGPATRSPGANAAGARHHDAGPRRRPRSPRPLRGGPPCRLALRGARASARRLEFLHFRQKISCGAGCSTCGRLPIGLVPDYETLSMRPQPELLRTNRS